MPLMNTIPASRSWIKRSLFGGVAGPGGGAESEGRVVGNLDRLVDVACAE